MNKIKVLAAIILSIAATSCMVIPPEMNGAAGVYSNGSPQPPVIIQQPTQQPVIIQQPAQPVIIQQPEHHKQHCYDSYSGEYLKVPPHSNRCREWLRKNQQERDRQHLCVDRKTGHYVHGVPAKSPDCHRLNNPPRHEPPRHQPPRHEPPRHQHPTAPVPPPAAPIKQPQPPVQAPPAVPIKPPCIDKRTGKAVNGVSANDLRCAKINH